MIPLPFVRGECFIDGLPDLKIGAEAAGFARFPPEVSRATGERFWGSNNMLSPVISSRKSRIPGAWWIDVRVHPGTSVCFFCFTEKVGLFLLFPELSPPKLLRLGALTTGGVGKYDRARCVTGVGNSRGVPSGCSSFHLGS